MNSLQNQLLILPKTSEKDEQKLKREVLIAWILKENINTGIIFCNSKILIRGLVLSLSRRGIKACGMHNQMSVNNLHRNIEKFEHMESNFIICADDAIDGIEVPCLEHLINFDCPSSLDILNLRKRTLDTSLEESSLMTILNTKEIVIIKDIFDKYKEYEITNESFHVAKISDLIEDMEDVAIPTFLDTKKPKKITENRRYVEEPFSVRRNRYRNAGNKESKYIHVSFNKNDSNINDYIPEFIERKIKIKP